MASILGSRAGVVTMIEPSARSTRSFTGSGPNAENSGAPVAPDKGVDRLAKVVLPIRTGMIRDELSLKNFGPFAFLMKELVDRGNNLAELYFFKGEMHRLRNKKDDGPKSLEFYAKARKAMGTPPPEIHRSIGLVHQKLGHAKDARAAFKAYLAGNPNAGDRAMIKYFIGKLGP